MGRIKSRDLQFLVVVGAVIGLLAYLSLTGRERFIPRTRAHLDVAAIRDNAQADAVCLSCHDGKPPSSPGIRVGPPMPKDHPLRKTNCRQCHRLERKKP